VKLPGWLAAIVSDVVALRTHWSGVRGGWRAARRDAEELVKYRRLLVDTSAMTPDGMAVVLRTRLRIIGDTQTDILRRWLATATPEAVERTSKTHFQAVAAALGGWNAARAMERVVIRLGWVIGGGWSASVLLRTPTSDLRHVLWTNWHLLAGIAAPVVLGLARQVMRWRLRALFHRGLTASLAKL